MKTWEHPKPRWPRASKTICTPLLGDEILQGFTLIL